MIKTLSRFLVMCSARSSSTVIIAMLAMLCSFQANALNRLTVDIVPHPSLAQAGKRLDYEVIVNSGTASPCSGSVRIDLPSGVNFIYAETGGVYSSSDNSVQWPRHRLHNSVLHYHAHVDVPSGFTGDLSALASISGGCSASSGTVITPVDPGPMPVLGISKSASKTSADAGEQIVYSLNYKNTGNATATNVVITDTLPTGVTFDAASNPGIHAAGTVTWNLPSVAAGTTGSVTTTVTVNSPISDGTVLTNNANINSTETSPVDATPIDVTATSAPVILISKSAPSHVKAGEQFTYFIDYGNPGSDTATGVTIEEILPAGLIFVSADNGGVEAGGTITWSVPDLLAGGAHRVSAVVEALSPQTDGTVITNDQLYIGSTETGRIRTFKDTDVTVDSRPTLTLNKTVSKQTAKAGETLTYTLSYTNVGSDVATGVRLQDILPADVTFDSATGGGALSTANGVDEIDWSLGTLAAGASGSVTVRASINTPIADGTVLHNSAAISSAEVTQAVTAIANTTVSSAPQLQISKAVSKSKALDGDSLVYTITYSNTGTDVATDVSIQDHLSSDVTFVKASGLGAYAGGVVLWNLGDVTAGTTNSVTITATVNPSVPSGTVLHNATTIDGSNTNPVSAAVAPADVTIIGQPSFLLVPQVQPTAIPGDTLVYTFLYENDGTTVATNTRLTSVLPPGVTFVSASGSGTLSGNIITWDLGSLGVRQTGSVTATVTVNSPLADGTRLTNSASIKDMGGHGFLAGVTTTINSLPVLTLTKSASKSVARPGDTIIYTLNFANTGTDQATNVMLEDHLPPEVTFGSAVGATESGGVVDWSLGTLAAGATGSVNVTVTVNTPLPDGTILHNDATIDSAQTAPVAAQRVDIPVNSAPVLSVSKTASRATASPGDTIVYTISYLNSGTDEATNVRIEDHLPTDVTFVSATGSAVVNGGIVDWNIGTLAAGTSGSVSVTVTVNTPLANGTTLHNTVSIDSTETSHISSPVVDVIVTSAPVLSTLTKTVSKTTASPGQTLVYTINYSNTGTTDATNVVLEDHLPPNVLFVSASTPGTESGGVVTWNIGTVGAGASGSATVTVAVASPLANGTRLKNSATITSTETTPFTAPSLPVTVSSAPVFSIAKQASRPIASPGDTVVYTIDFLNSGNDQATGVVLEDPLPAELTFVSATGGGTESAGTVTWNLGAVPAGKSSAVTVTATVKDPLANGTILHNGSTINSVETTPTSSPVVDVTISSAPLLKVSKLASSNAINAGGTLTYTLSYSNTGNDAATAVVLEDHLPPEVLFLTASNGGTESSAGVVTWNIGTVGAGVSGSATVTVAVASPLANGTVLHNVSSIDSTETAPSSGQPTDVKVTSAPVLTLTKMASAPVVNAGGQLTYTLSYSNSGSDTATGIVLQDPLPPEVSFVSATSGGTVNAGTVNWNLPDLPAGSSGSVSVTVAVVSPLANGTVLHNSANIDSVETPPLASALVDVTVSSAPALLVSKIASSPTVTAGGQISYTLTYKNFGSDQASNVTIVDNLPPELTFSSASAGGINNAGVVTWSLPTLAPGAGGSVTLSAIAESPLADGTVLPNSSSISATGVLPGVAPIVPVTVLSSPAFTLSKTPSLSTVNAGGQVSFDLQYSNVGTDTATAVAVVDQLPANTTFVSASGGVTPDSSGLITWNIGAVPAQSGGSVSVTLAVDSPLPDGTVIANQASITSIETPPLSAVGQFVVSSAPELAIQKTAASSVVQAGGQVLYSVQVGNTGSDAAAGVTIVDTIPIGGSLVAVGQGGQYDPVAATLTWSIPSLAAGATFSADYTLQVPVGIADGTLWLNTASVQAQNAASATSQAQVTIGSQPVLEILKTGGNSVNAGANLTYTLEYRNTGNTTAQNVVIQDAVPAGLTFVSASNGGVFSAGTVSWSLGNLPAGGGSSVTLTLQAPLGAIDGTVYPNTASASAANAAGATSSTNSVLRSHVELDILINGAPGSVAAGADVNFLVSYSNLGNEVATNAALNASLPSNTTFVSATSGGIFNAGTGEVEWTLGSLGAGVSASVQFLVTVVDPLANGTTTSSTANISADNGLSESATATIAVSSAPLLIIGKASDVSTASLGDTVNFTISLENFGNAVATGVLVTDTLPVELKFVSAASGGQFDTNTNQVTWNVGSISSGAPATQLKLQTRIIAFAPTVTNIAEVSASMSPTVSVSRSISLTEVVPPAPIPALPRVLLILLSMLMAAVGLLYVRTRAARGEI